MLLRKRLSSLEHTKANISGRPEQWVYAAVQLGIPVRRHSSMLANIRPQAFAKPSRKLTVIGDRCLGELEKPLAFHAKRFAMLFKLTC